MAASRAWRGNPVNGVEFDGHHICDVSARKTDATRKSCEEHNRLMADGKWSYHKRLGCTSQPIYCPNHLGQYSTFQQNRQAMLNSKYRRRLSAFAPSFGPPRPLNLVEKRTMNGQPLTDGIDSTWEDLLWVVPAGSVARGIGLIGRGARSGAGLIGRALGVGGAKEAGEQVATAPARRRTLFEMVFERNGGRGAPAPAGQIVIRGTSSTGLERYYPQNNGFLGGTTRIFLRPGQLIDRFGGNDYSRFFSPIGTRESVRALPPGTSSQPIRLFEVIKPLEVEAGRVAPAFGQIGGGVQYRTPVTLRVLLDRGIIREVR